jgi:hypothetical protein
MMRRVWSGLAAAGLMASLAVITPAAAVEKAAAAPATINDIDGDGLLDVVYSFRGEGSDEDDGVLMIAYGDGHQQRFFGQGGFGYSLPDPPLYDRDFASHTEVANLNGDQYADVVVMGRGIDLPDSYLFIALGSADGISLDRIERVEVPVFGDDLTVMTKPDPLIIVSADSAVVNGVESGALYAVPVTAAGKAKSGQLISQNSAGIPGSDEADDRFGASVDADGSTLVVGTPGEDTTKANDTGMIDVLRRSGGTSFTGVGIHQDTADVPGSAEVGDHFGESVAIEDGHVAVGLPGEDIGSVKDAGMVTYFTDNGTTTTVAGAFNQDSPGIPGSNETQDAFGQSVGFTRPCSGQRAILAGAPESSDERSERTTVVNLNPAASCTNKLLAGYAVSARHATAANKADSVIVAEQSAYDYDNPFAVERTFPYTAVVKQWGRGDVDGGLIPVAPMSK